ncbi:hypothetical protein [Methylobacterium gnaphalii]|nr:hypothetical protein [Methylobacterium gnaphalii]
MKPSAEQWDVRVSRYSEKLPPRGQRILAWLRDPSRFWIRIFASLLLILGGTFSILPVLGLWMLPLGLALLAQDVPGLKVPMEAVAQAIERGWARLTNRK